MTVILMASLTTICLKTINGSSVQGCQQCRQKLILTWVYVLAWHSVHCNYNLLHCCVLPSSLRMSIRMYLRLTKYLAVLSPIKNPRHFPEPPWYTSHSTKRTSQTCLCISECDGSCCSHYIYSGFTQQHLKEWTDLVQNAPPAAAWRRSLAVQPKHYIKK